MESNPIARMAASLSSVQREVMTSQMYRYEVSPYRRTGDALVRMGLLKQGKDFEMFETYTFTYLGRKVRALLLEEKHGELEEWKWE